MAKKLSKEERLAQMVIEFGADNLIIAIEETVRPKTKTAFSMAYGATFRTGQSVESIIYMRVKPISFLNNSNLVMDMHHRKRIFVVNINSGTLNVLAGDTAVFPTDVAMIPEVK